MPVKRCPYTFDAARAHACERAKRLSEDMAIYQGVEDRGQGPEQITYVQAAYALPPDGAVLVEVWTPDGVRA